MATDLVECARCAVDIFGGAHIPLSDKPCERHKSWPRVFEPADFDEAELLGVPLLSHHHAEGEPMAPTTTSAPPSRTNDTDDHDRLATLRAEAEARLSELRAMPLGGSYAELEDQARRAASALDGYARAQPFSVTLTRLDDAVVRDFQIALETLPGPPESLAGPLAAAHLEALDTYPELAATLRGLRGMKAIAARARMTASYPAGLSITEALALAERKAIAKFQKLVIPQLAERDMFTVEIEIMTAVVPGLLRAIDEIVQRHVEHARTEDARLEAEQQAKDEETKRAMVAARVEAGRLVLASETREWSTKRELLAQWYENKYPDHTFPIESELLTGLEVAVRLREGGRFDLFYSAQGFGIAPKRRRS